VECGVWNFEQEEAEVAESNHRGTETQRTTTEYGYVVCQGEPVVESSSENFEKEKGGQVGWTLSFPFS
jgi:hypothetical protein